MADSGLLFQRFAENLTPASPPKADIKLILSKEAANDPKRPSVINEGSSLWSRRVSMVFSQPSLTAGQLSIRMDDLTVARAIHVIGVVFWIGGFGFVTTVLLTGVRRMKDPQERVSFFERIEN